MYDSVNQSTINFHFITWIDWLPSFPLWMQSISWPHTLKFNNIKIIMLPEARTFSCSFYSFSEDNMHWNTRYCKTRTKPAYRKYWAWRNATSSPPCSPPCTYTPPRLPPSRGWCWRDLSRRRARWRIAQLQTCNGISQLIIKGEFRILRRRVPSNL